MNLAAIDRGVDSIVTVDVPDSWKDAVDAPVADSKVEPDFIANILRPCNALKGDDLPVSTFLGYQDGTVPLGTSAYEKRGIDEKKFTAITSPCSLAFSEIRRGSCSPSEGPFPRMRILPEAFIFCAPARATWLRKSSFTAIVAKKSRVSNVSRTARINFSDKRIGLNFTLLQN